MKWRCLLGHHWVKHGGTRVEGGLHRACSRCGARDEGFESGNSKYRWIEWRRVNQQLQKKEAKQ